MSLQKATNSAIQYEYPATLQARTFYTVFVRLRDQIMKHSVAKAATEKTERIFYSHADVPSIFGKELFHK